MLRFVVRWRVMHCLTGLLMLVPSFAPLAVAQTPAPATSATAAVDDATEFNAQQLDALLAPVALYPDTLLTQVLMASAYSPEIVNAAHWVEEPANKGLKGDALEQALVPQSWDPSVKSLAPFPQILVMMNTNLEWTQQVGYAFTTQQVDVLNSVQRLRLQAQEAGNLKSSEQQVVRTDVQTIIIEPADPQVIYVPTYSPAQVYGTWPYATYPPVVLPPPPGYVVGTALVRGIAFGVGVAMVGGLWGIGSPNWGRGNVNVNVNRYNSINVNRTQIRSPEWRPPARAPGTSARRPDGPVGRPARAAGLPPNAVGRPSVQVHGDLVNKPIAPSRDQPALGGKSASPGPRPGAGAAASRPSAGPARPAPKPAAPPAFAGRSEGKAAGDFQARGNQSRQQAQRAPARPQTASRAPSGRGGGRGGGGRNR